MSLGTAQLGMSYGINNTLGQPTETTAQLILNAAYDAGVRVIDTANTYGTSQRILGQSEFRKAFQIFSKFRKSDGHGDLIAATERAIAEIKVDRLEGMWLHEFSDLMTVPNLVKDSVTLKEMGVIKYFGVSVYSNSDIESAANIKSIDCIQLPFNIFDNWHFRSESIKKAKSAGKKIFVRSVYLQGLLLMEENQFPKGLGCLLPALKKARQAAKDQSLSMADFSLLYPFQFSEIDYVIIGCESLIQLQKNINCLSGNPKVDYSDLQNLEVEDRSFLNPIKWIGL